MVTLTRARSDRATVSTSVARAASRRDDRSDNAHRQLIGYFGLVLPFVLPFIALARDGMDRWKSLDSISAYYYTGAVALFVGMLFALAVFLFAYQGYANKYNLADQLAAKTAAVAALVVAFFPAKEPPGVAPLSWWTPSTGVVHHVAAAVLFATFAMFALFLFRLTAGGGPSVTDKGWRNHFYLACGLVIIGCIAWAGVNGWHHQSIYWPESIALIAFALSWLVKGYALRTIVGTARSLLRSQKTSSPPASDGTMTTLDHVAIWAVHIELMRSFYEKYFDARANAKYENVRKRFTSYFLTFPGGGRLELMHRPDIERIPDSSSSQEFLGYAHLGVELGSRAAVDALTKRLKGDGFSLLDGPRLTGDGYYESTVLDPDGNRLELTV